VEHRFTTGIQARESAVAFPGAGGDEITLRIDAEHGECPVAVVEGVSADRGWAPAHSHPWDEVTYVLEGEIEFIVGGERGGGGPGTIVSLPRGVSHTLRVPQGTARYLMVTLGAPSVAFLREVGEAYAEGPTFEKLVEIAGRHGVRPAGG
jgi:quercetin dioxygenase-like cupin family protein